jgi:hypothetical protein
LKVLIACEFSGRVRDAFLQRGHDALSCDLLPSESPGPHYEGDIKDILFSENWDLMIAHPPCTYLTTAANRFFDYPGRKEKREEAIKFFMELVNAPVSRIAIENPVGYINTLYRSPDQIIQPYYFGHPVKKTTCLWLKNLPLLQPTEMLPEPKPLYIRETEKGKGKKIHWCETIGGSREHKFRERSRTFEGIAEAMANQWGNYKSYPYQASLSNWNLFKI